MAMADVTNEQTCHYLTTYWAHEGVQAPKFPVKVGGRDVKALLDSTGLSGLEESEPRPWGKKKSQAAMWLL